MVGEDEMMISFDVRALYITLPTEKAPAVARERLTGDCRLSERASLDVDDITGLLRFCIDLFVPPW